MSESETTGAASLLKRCGLCPRSCGIDRLAGKTGFCGAGRDARVSLVSLHHWEEPCLSGERGSGTVFFSRCNLRCVFCQNHAISIRVKYHLKVPVGKSAEAKEAFSSYLVGCPAAQSVIGCIDIQHDLAIEEMGG